MNRRQPWWDWTAEQWAAYRQQVAAWLESTHWGLCERHAREDDPTAFDSVEDDRREFERRMP